MTLGVTAIALAALAGCSLGDSRDGAAVERPGDGEGALALVAPPGFVKDGSGGDAVDWVSEFERESNCEVRVRVSPSSGTTARLLRSGRFDGGAVPGDAAVSLIAAGAVEPIDTELLSNFNDVYDALKEQPFNSLDGVAYGVPHGRGANLMLYDPREVDPPPESWSALFDRAAEHSGRISVHDHPLSIADAALYLRERRPELAIDDPYALDRRQFGAAVDLLEDQRPHVGAYWRSSRRQVDSFAGGDASLGTGWQVTAYLLNARGEPEEAVMPREGSTGWSDTWMLAAGARHPNCMYRWMDHIIGPGANAEAASWLGEAPANEKACELTADANHCDIYRADDEGFYDDVEMWRRPVADCGDNRGEACVPYEEWVEAWNHLRGER